MDFVRRLFNRAEDTDLSEEQIEELLYSTKFTKQEIIRYRRKFLKLVETAEPDGGVITLDEFFNINSMRINPLKDRLAAAFGFEIKGNLPERHMPQVEKEDEENILDELFGGTGEMLNNARAAANLGAGAKKAGDEETKEEPSTDDDGAASGGAEGAEGTDAALALAETGGLGAAKLGPSMKTVFDKDVLIDCDQTISFKRFLEGLSLFNTPGQRDAKLAAAFKIQDFDGDGKLGRQDLILYFRRIVLFQDALTPQMDGALSKEKQAAAIADKVLGEASSSPEHDKERWITMDDFRRIVAPMPDFESKLFINV